MGEREKSPPPKRLKVHYRSQGGARTIQTVENRVSTCAETLKSDPVQPAFIHNESDDFMETYADTFYNSLVHFIQELKSNPTILHSPEFKFFKDYIESLGGRIPNTSANESHLTTDFKSLNIEPETAAGGESDESDIDLQKAGVLEPDEVEPLPELYRHPVSEEKEDKAEKKYIEGCAAAGDQDHHQALKLFTEAIELNPCKAVLYAKRAGIYLTFEKPNACIQDCNRALEINPNVSFALKHRGRAHRQLGHWEEAYEDLKTAWAGNIYDVETSEWLDDVRPYVRKHMKQTIRKSKREKEETMRRFHEMTKRRDQRIENMFKNFEDFLQQKKKNLEFHKQRFQFLRCNEG